jgi:hypothetical protein
VTILQVPPDPSVQPSQGKVSKPDTSLSHVAAHGGARVVVRVTRTVSKATLPRSKQLRTWIRSWKGGV